MTGPSHYPVFILRGENQTAEYYFNILNKLILFVVYRNIKMKFLASLISGLACGSKLYLDWSLDFEDAINIGGPVVRENGSLDFMLIDRDQKVSRFDELQSIGISRQNSLGFS